MRAVRLPGLAVIAALVVDCASPPPPALAVEFCPMLSELPPHAEDVCEAKAILMDYEVELLVAWSKNVSRRYKRQPMRLTLTYADGPAVESACVTGWGYDFELSMLVPAARAASGVPIPAELSCLTGRRFDLLLNQPSILY